MLNLIKNISYLFVAIVAVNIILRFRFISDKPITFLFVLYIIICVFLLESGKNRSNKEVIHI